jgi:hypothetical protein
MQGQDNSKKVCSHHEHEVCAPCKVFYKGITCFWESIVCPKGYFDVWYKKKCLYGSCSACGVGKLPFCLEELNGIDERPVQWRHYALEETI